MELLQGDNLRDRLSASKQKPLPLPELLEISAQICDGSQAAHDKGIIHLPAEELDSTRAMHRSCLRTQLFPGPLLLPHFRTQRRAE
jgi:hypothetical protein